MSNWESAGGRHRLWHEGELVGQIQELPDGWFLWELKIAGVPYQRGRVRHGWQAFLWANRAFEFATGRTEERPLCWDGPESVGGP